VLRQPALRDGDWQLLECVPAWEGNWTWDCFVAFAWQAPDGERLLVAVNYAPNQSQCYVQLPFSDLAHSQWTLRGLLDTTSYDREGDSLERTGLYLDVPGWQTHVFSMRQQPR
jgi:hypothetical protein